MQNGRPTECEGDVTLPVKIDSHDLLSPQSENQRRFSCQRGDSPIASPVNNVLTSGGEDFDMSCESYWLCRADLGIVLLNSSFFFANDFHEFDRRAVGITNVNDALAGIRTGFERLRFASRFPTGGHDPLEHDIQVVDNERNVDVPDIARPNVRAFAVWRREILEQFNLVATRAFTTASFSSAPFTPVICSAISPV